MNLGWNQISTEQREKILKKISDHIESGNHVCRVGWACERILKKKVQPNVLDKLAAKITETGIYSQSPANYLFKYDWNIKKTSLLEIEAKQLDIKTKRRQLKWFYPLLVISLISISIAGFSAYINFSNLRSQKKKLEDLENKLNQLNRKHNSIRNNVKDSI